MVDIDYNAGLTASEIALNTAAKTILFYQHFGHANVFRGAHYKTLDYFKHLQSLPGYEPVIVFDEDSAWGPDIPWFDQFTTMPTLASLSALPDALFLNSGKDWLRYQAHCVIPDELPIISPVNHFRALNPDHRAFQLLSRPATRLCPSPELYQAVKDHPLTQGETVYLPNAIHQWVDHLPVWQERTIDVLVVGNKNPTMAAQLAAALRPRFTRVQVIDRWLPQAAFQAALANSRYSVHLPMPVEAHYLPALEAMLLGSVVLVPDCVGNMSYAQHGQTCYVPDYEVMAMVQTLAQIQDKDHQPMIETAMTLAQSFSPQQERLGLQRVLQRVFGG